MRVPLLAAVLFSLLTAIGGAAGMYVYLNNQYDMRSNRREAPTGAEIADDSGLKTGNLKRDDKPSDVPEGNDRAKDKPTLLPKNGETPDTTAGKAEPGADTTPEKNDRATPPKAEGPDTTRRDAPPKVEDLAKRATEVELANLDDLLGKRVDFAVNVSGTVTDGKGNPVAGADVFADINERAGDGDAVMMFNFNDSGEKVAVSDANGNFSGTVKSKTGEKSQVTLVMRAKAKGHAESKKVNVEAKNGDTKTDIKLVLRSAGSVRGRVVDQNGLGLAGVTVSLSNSRGTGGMEMPEIYGGPNQSKNSAVSDVAGNYIIEDVAEGSYAFNLRAPGYREKSGPRNADVKADQITQMDSDFVLAATTCLRAKLVGEDGKPLAGWVTVELTPAAGGNAQRLNAMVGPDGSLAINDPPVGEFNVVVKLWGYFDSPKTFQVFTQDQTTDLGSVTLAANPEAASKGRTTKRVGRSGR